MKLWNVLSTAIWLAGRIHNWQIHTQRHNFWALFFLVFWFCSASSYLDFGIDWNSIDAEIRLAGNRKVIAEFFRISQYVLWRKNGLVLQLCVCKLLELGSIEYRAEIEWTDLSVRLIVKTGQTHRICNVLSINFNKFVASYK